MRWLLPLWLPAGCPAVFGLEEGCWGYNRDGQLGDGSAWREDALRVSRPAM